MTRDLIPYFSLFLILLSTLELLVGTRLRRMMIALAIMYLGQFLLLINNWSLGLSAVELVAGWMAMAILLGFTTIRGTRSAIHQSPGHHLPDHRSPGHMAVGFSHRS